MSFLTTATVLPARVAADPALAEQKKASFIDEKTLTFTVANTGGIGVLTVAGLLGQTIDAQLIAAVAIVLGLLVTALGTPWVNPRKSRAEMPEFVRGLLGTVAIGLFNTALLAVALWGSVNAIEAALG